MRKAYLVPAAALALCGAALAQHEGHFITTVSHAGVGRMFDVDPSTRKSTEFTLPASIKNDSVNTITMLTPTMGWVGTIGTAATSTAPGIPSDIYQISVDWANHKITATKLNTNPLGGYNLAQITRVGSTLYFVTSDFSLTGTAGNANGVLHSMPMAGGAATQLLKISAASVTGWVDGRSANACATDGKVVYIAAWYTGEIVAYDIATKAAKMVGTLPGKLSTYPYPVSVHMDGKNLVAGGLYGDVIFWDTTTNTAVKHLTPKTADTGAHWSPYKNSIVQNADTGDWVFGSRDACVEPVTDTGTGSLARRQVILIPGPYSTTNNPDGLSVNGIWHFAAGANASSYTAYGDGCSNSSAGDFVPTGGGGIVKKASPSFSFLLDGAPPQSIGVLMFGASQVSIPFACGTLRTLPVLTLPIATTPSDAGLATANGTYRATVGPFAVPNVNFKLATQWIVVFGAPPKMIFTEGRTLAIQ